METKELKEREKSTFQPWVMLRPESGKMESLPACEFCFEQRLRSWLDIQVVKTVLEDIHIVRSQMVLWDWKGENRETDKGRGGPYLRRHGALEPKAEGERGVSEKPKEKECFKMEG